MADLSKLAKAAKAASVAIDGALSIARLPKLLPELHRAGGCQGPEESEHCGKIMVS